MTITARNELFEENMNWIRFVIRKNRPLIHALKLDPEDVSQELAICMIKAIETYDPSKGAKLSTYIVYKLQFGVLALYGSLKRGCRAANINTRSIDNAYEDEQTLDIPVEIDFHSDLFAGEICSHLTENEKEVINLRINGVGLQNKRQKRLMDRARKKITKFYMARAEGC